MASRVKLFKRQVATDHPFKCNRRCRPLVQPYRWRSSKFQSFKDCHTLRRLSRPADGSQLEMLHIMSVWSFACMQMTGRNWPTKTALATPTRPSGGQVTNFDLWISFRVGPSSVKGVTSLKTCSALDFFVLLKAKALRSLLAGFGYRLGRPTMWQKQTQKIGWKRCFRANKARPFLNGIIGFPSFYERKSSCITRPHTSDDNILPTTSGWLKFVEQLEVPASFFLHFSTSKTFIRTGMHSSAVISSVPIVRIPSNSNIARFASGEIRASSRNPSSTRCAD